MEAGERGRIRRIIHRCEDRSPCPRTAAWILFAAHHTRVVNPLRDMLDLVY